MKTVLAAILIFNAFFLSSQTFADIQDYFDTVDRINQHLDDIQNRRVRTACQGASLVLSCGDGKCESKAGENATNCPADCVNTPVKSYDHGISCANIQEYYEPVSVSQMVQLVNYALNSGVHFRVVGSRHSVNDQYCNGGIVAGTAKLNRILGIIKEVDGSESVLVEPGVVLGDLAEWLHARDRSLGYAHLGFRKATVGGAIANGAHGSSLKHDAVISNLVRSVTLVDGRGRLREINEARWPLDYLRAARAHLGVLGAVVKVKLAIVPQFKLRASVTDGHDDALLVQNGLLNQVQACDFALINWFPNSHRFIKTCGVQSTKPADDGAENTLLSPPVPSWLTQPYKVALHYGMCYDTLNATLEGFRYLQLKWLPPFRKADAFGDVSSTSDLVGYAHRIMSSELITDDSKFFTRDWELAVPFSKAQAALLALSDYARLTRMRLPLVGVFLRFAPSSDRTLMAHTTSVGTFQKDEPVVFFEFPTPTPVGLSLSLTRSINSVYEGLARLLITEFGARPHWGKNATFTFELQNQMQSYGNNLARFQAVKDDLDPNGLFLSDFDVAAGFR